MKKRKGEKKKKREKKKEEEKKERGNPLAPRKTSGYTGLNLVILGFRYLWLPGLLAFFAFTLLKTKLKL